MQSQKTGYPKWDGLIDLQEAGLPIPKAFFIQPNSQEEKITNIVNSFIVKTDSRLIALRPDGIKGIGKTPPGIGFEKTEEKKIIKKLIEWSKQGYGVTLLEGHNRFDYDFCCNVLLTDKEGNFIIEFVGPGFDGGDLNKAILKPSIIVTNKPESPIFIYSDPISGEANTDALENLCFRINIEKRVPTNEEIETRLRYIMERLLPDMGIKIEKTIDTTKKWLEEHHCSRLFKKEKAGYFLSMNDLQYIILSASKYIHNLLCAGKKINNHALTAHKFNNKIIFFGTYDGQKWGPIKSIRCDKSTYNYRTSSK